MSTRFTEEQRKVWLEEKQKRGTAEPKEGRCGEHLSKTNPPRYCTAYPMKGQKNCKGHGGRINRGIASASFKHGKHSRYLPERMIQDFDAALKNPDLISLRADLATVEARLNDILKRVDTGEAGCLWKDLQKTHQAFKVAKAEGKVADMATLLDAMGKGIDKGMADWAVWQEAIALIEQRRKLVDSEIKRLQALQVYVDSGQVLTLLTSLALQIKEIIENRELTVRQQLNKVQTLLSKSMGQA